MSSRLFAALAVAALVGCDRKGTDLLPDNSAFSPVVTIGELGVMSAEDYWNFRISSDPQAWCVDEANADSNGNQRCYYGQLGMPEAGVRGGASYTFTVPTIVPPEGVEADEVEQLDTVCVMMDPETVFWNHSVAELDRETKDLYPDFHDDDGDLDMSVGLSSYYTGSPGVELGDFRGYFTDSLGRTIEIEYGECVQRGSPYPGEHHGGRGHLEWCDIDVEGRQGVQFTVVLETFSVPLDDGALGYGSLVYAGSCSDLISSPREEQVIPEESMVAEDASDGDFATKACTKNLELAVSAGLEQEFCCVHPEMCSGRVPDDVCQGFAETYDVDNEDFQAAAANFCAYSPVVSAPSGLGLEEHLDLLSEYQRAERNDETVSMGDYGYGLETLCCEDYSVVNPANVELLVRKPVPDTALPQDEWPAEFLTSEYLTPYTPVFDFLL
mgnify:CR=1 FL=1